MLFLQTESLLNFYQKYNFKLRFFHFAVEFSMLVTWFRFNGVLFQIKWYADDTDEADF